MEDTICGQIISGEVGKILIREKNGKKFELGDLLVSEGDKGKILLQIYDLMYGSQISGTAREQISGMKLEGFSGDMTFLEPELRNYVLAHAKAILQITDSTHTPKILPDFFGTVRNVEREDLKILTEERDAPVYVGKVRSGSKVIDVPVYLESKYTLPHHVLICSTTGRGKSNLVKNMLWSMMGQKKVGALVLDPHDEYYGRSSKGMKDHPRARGNVSYYSVNPLPGTNSLVINLKSLRLEHLEGIVDFSDTQIGVMRDYEREFKEEWIEKILLGTKIEGMDMNKQRVTIAVLQRKFRSKLSVYVHDGEIVCKNRVFSTSVGESTVKDILNSIEKGNIVILDTSKLGDDAELVIGSMIASELLERHQDAKADGTLDQVPPVSIVIEEAPRVLGSDKLQQGDNIYSTIAREGRKFKVGLMAITQLVSVIPIEVLANMNTKIIMGNEMASERNAIIQSAAQDLSQDSRNIASLDIGEAIVSSVFTRFAVPIKVSLFEEVVELSKSQKQELEYKG
ncbi:MAG: ATP-binding protein [Clostridia bacterium]